MDSTTDYLSSRCLIQNTKDLSRIEAELARVTDAPDLPATQPGASSHNLPILLMVFAIEVQLTTDKYLNKVLVWSG